MEYSHKYHCVEIVGDKLCPILRCEHALSKSQARLDWYLGYLLIIQNDLFDVQLKHSFRMSPVSNANI